MNLEECKQLVGKQAAQLVENHMILGLGTGSTMAYFIEALGQRCEKGLTVHAIATSESSTQRAKKAKIPLISIDSAPKIHLTVDGADQIDDCKCIVKGGGGALLREKIVASMSQEILIIADETKLVSHLGSKPLPIEIVPFGYLNTLKKIDALGGKGMIRKNSDQSPFITENHHMIYDFCSTDSDFDPRDLHSKLISIPGVVETGFFLDSLDSVHILIAYKDGHLSLRG